MNRAMKDDAMMRRLDRMTVPSKPFVCNRASGLGIKIAHSLRDTFGATCRFERKGSVFDDKILHVSDVDVLIFIESGVGLATAMAHVLETLELHPYAVTTRDVCGREIELQTNVLPDDAFNESIETISVSMPLRMGKHTLPLDLTFTTATKGRDEPIEHRIQKLDANIKIGKFDKALQRLRPLLTRLGATWEVRGAITAAMNDRTGFVRFVHKQLKLSVDSKRVTHAVAALGIQSDELEHALEVAMRRNVVEAEALIVEFIDEIKAVAEGGAFEGSVRAALAPLDRSVVTIKDTSVCNDLVERLHTAWQMDRHIQSIRKGLDDNVGNGLAEDVLSLHLFDAEEKAERHRAVRLGNFGYFVFS
jgi:hypothetical protein